MEMPSNRRSSGPVAPSARGALKFAMRSRRIEMKYPITWAMGFLTPKRNA